MKAMTLKRKLMEWTVEHSGVEERNYLGMSQIGRCRRELYEQMVSGREWSEHAHQMCYIEYLFERDILARLEALGDGLLGPGEELVALEGRFQGHTDGTFDGELLEIKSTVDAKVVEMIENDGRIPWGHYCQVQTYLHFSEREWATVVYVARDSGAIYVAAQRRHKDVGEQMVDKAKEILAAVDAGEAPACECGRCR